MFWDKLEEGYNAVVKASENQEDVGPLFLYCKDSVVDYLSKKKKLPPFYAISRTSGQARVLIETDSRGWTNCYLLSDADDDNKQSCKKIHWFVISEEDIMSGLCAITLHVEAPGIKNAKLSQIRKAEEETTVSERSGFEQWFLEKSLGIDGNTFNKDKLAKSMKIPNEQTYVRKKARAKAHLSRCLNPNRSYSTSIITDWKGIMARYDKSLHKTLKEFDGLPLPDYLQTSLHTPANEKDGKFIFMCWVKHSVVVCKSFTPAAVLRDFRQLGWKVYKLGDIDFEELRKDIKNVG